MAANRDDAGVHLAIPPLFGQRGSLIMSEMGKDFQAPPKGSISTGAAKCPIFLLGVETLEEIMTGIPTAQVAKLLGNLSRQRVSALAKWWGWRSVSRGVYALDDVQRYLDARRRTFLLRKAGYRFRGLVWNEELDAICPRCGQKGVKVGDDGETICDCQE